MRKSQSKSSDLSKRRLGGYGEELAARWYQANDYTIVARNWRCREGEIDLICRRKDTLVFCEVKTRSGTGFGHPAEAVNWSKQARLHRLAARYLSEGDQGYVHDIRFDVAAVIGQQVDVIEAAF